MASYPSSIYSGTPSAGTSTLSNPDHSARHNNVDGELTAIETALGTTAGTSVLKAFNAGDFPVRVNSSNTLQQAINGGTIGTTTIGTSTIKGGTANNQAIGTPLITGGTANGMVLGTPTIGTITVPGTVAGLSFSAAIAPGVGTVTDAAGGTLTVNAQQGNLFYSAFGTAAGNRTIGTPLNPTGYQQLTYAFKASGSANGTLIWDSGVFRFSDVGTPALGTASTWNYYGWRYNAIDSKYDFQGQSKNII